MRIRRVTRRVPEVVSERSHEGRNRARTLIRRRRDSHGSVQSSGTGTRWNPFVPPPRRDGVSRRRRTRRRGRGAAFWRIGPVPRRRDDEMKASCVVAIDQGTTNTRVLVVDDHGQVVASAGARATAPLSTPGVGRARSRAHLGRHVFAHRGVALRFRAFRSRCRRNRHREPARDRRLVGTIDGSSGVERDRVAGPSHHADVSAADRRRCRGMGPRTYRSRARSLFLSVEDRLAPRQRFRVAPPAPSKVTSAPARSRVSSSSG